MRGVAIGSIPAKRACVVRNSRVVNYANRNEGEGKRENPREASCPVPDEIGTDLYQQREEDKGWQHALRSQEPTHQTHRANLNCTKQSLIRFHESEFHNLTTACCHSPVLSAWPRRSRNELERRISCQIATDAAG